MPILLLILCGYVARRTGFLTEQTAAQINRFNFRFGYFALMFYNVYGVDVKKALPLMLLGITLGIIILLTLIGWAASAFLTKERARRGVLIQSAFRSNYACWRRLWRDRKERPWSPCSSSRRSSISIR